MLQVEDLRTHFFTARGTVRAVDGVTLRVDRGATLAVVGGLLLVVLLALGVNLVVDLLYHAIDPRVRS